jgi:NifB/MoaA-like Fe-S oxidoreductase
MWWLALARVDPLEISVFANVRHRRQDLRKGPPARTSLRLDCAIFVVRRA